MKKVTASMLAPAFGLLLMANANAQDAKPPLISNASFEAPAVEEGDYSLGIPGWGWAGSYLCVNAVARPGGPGSFEPWPATTPPGIDGRNFGQLFTTGDGGTGVLYQDTGIKYQAGKTYTLTAAFGLQANYQSLAPNCIIFFDNSSLAPLAWTTILEKNLISGAFKDQSVTFTATGKESPGDGAHGTPGDVIVGFWLPPSPEHTYLDVDNVRLKVEDSKSYENGPVTLLSYIKTKPGKFNDYMAYLDSSYKMLMEANKKAGLILSYNVYQAQPRSPQEPDLILSVTYPNMAALDKDDEADAVAAKVMGSMDAQSKGAVDRESLREFLGSELIRELKLK